MKLVSKLSLLILVVFGACLSSYGMRRAVAQATAAGRKAVKRSKSKLLLTQPRQNWVADNNISADAILQAEKEITGDRWQKKSLQDREAAIRAAARRIQRGLNKAAGKPDSGSDGVSGDEEDDASGAGSAGAAAAAAAAAGAGAGDKEDSKLLELDKTKGAVLVVLVLGAAYRYGSQLKDAVSSYVTGPIASKLGFGVTVDITVKPWQSPLEKLANSLTQAQWDKAGVSELMVKALNEPQILSHASNKYFIDMLDANQQKLVDDILSASSK